LRSQKFRLQQSETPLRSHIFFPDKANTNVPPNKTCPNKEMIRFLNCDNDRLAGFLGRSPILLFLPPLLSLMQLAPLFQPSFHLGHTIAADTCTDFSLFSWRGEKRRERSAGSCGSIGSWWQQHASGRRRARRRRHGRTHVRPAGGGAPAPSLLDLRSTPSLVSPLRLPVP